MNKSRVLFLLCLSLFGLSNVSLGQSAKNARTPDGFDNGISRKWEFRVSAGAQTGSRYDKALLFDLGLGYNVSSNWYMGLSSGLYYRFGAVDGLKSEGMIPVMADITWRSNPVSDRWSPFFQVLGGYLIPEKKTGTLEDEGTPYNWKGYTCFEFNPGLSLRPSRSVDVRFSLGYALAIPGDDGFDPARNYTEHLVMGKIGVSFRGKPNSPTRQQMIEEQDRAREAHQQEYKAQVEQQRAKAEAERRQDEAARAERRRQQQASGDVMPILAESPAAAEFYCHITADMIADGASFNNDLLNLASLVSGNQVSSIIVLGYGSDSQSGDASGVLEANNRAAKVRNYLSRRYYLNKDIITTVFSGFEDCSGQDSRPKNAIATIMIQRVAGDK